MKKRKQRANLSKRKEEIHGWVSSSAKRGDSKKKKPGDSVADFLKHLRQEGGGKTPFPKGSRPAPYISVVGVL